MDCFKVRFAHAKQSQVSEYDIAVLNLMLRPISCHIHAVEFFDEIAFPKDSTHNSQSAGRDNPFICKFDNDVLVRVQRDPAIIIHGKKDSNPKVLLCLFYHELLFTLMVQGKIEPKVLK